MRADKQTDRHAHHQRNDEENRTGLTSSVGDIVQTAEAAVDVDADLTVSTVVCIGRTLVDV